MAARGSLALVVAVLAWSTVSTAQIPQGVFTDIFPPEEFAARRVRVMDAIGDAVAILQGAPEKAAELQFRQSNQFFYLTGVEVPRAILVIDGRARRSTLYISAGGHRVRAYGPSLIPGAEAVTSTGIDAVAPREQFTTDVAGIVSSRRLIYTPFGGDVVGGGSRGEANGFATNTTDDPWDGRPSRENAFIEKLKVPGGSDLTIRNLDPVVDGLRMIKSRREIAIIREATQIAGEAITEAMREAEPGMMEYELQAVAEYVFKRRGAQGPAYFALIATGPNTVYSHYHKGTRTLAADDLVQFDYAPDYRYYVSDVTRVFPASGKFTPKQREFYTVYLGLYRALMSVIKPGVPVRELLQEAGRRMHALVDATTFTSPAIKTAATTFARRYRDMPPRSFGHSIGMEVHDVGLPASPDRPVMLSPGQLFTIEPALIVPEEGLAMRLEDALLVTERGYENLSASVPVEIADIERVMAEPGMTALLRSRKRQ